VDGHDEDLLELHDVNVSFAGIKAIDGVDLQLRQGEILGLIGPNGAGKTTLVNVLSGFQRPSPGRLVLAGRDATGWSPSRLALAGLSRTFQAVRLFGRLTVLENVEVGLVCAGSSRRRAHGAALSLLDRVGLKEMAARRAADLSYGDERRLGIARALATGPRFLLLDEPAAGLNETESEELLDTLGTIRRELGCGLLIIEHDMPLIMRLCDRVQVLDQGRTLAVGTPSEVRRDPAVLAAYLGTQAGDHA
jgi:branched-chain amino acid transport system ATP-binding protein